MYIYIHRRVRVYVYKYVYIASCRRVRTIALPVNNRSDFTCHYNSSFVRLAQRFKRD